jgi:hypothetical protein
MIARRARYRAAAGGRLTIDSTRFITYGEMLKTAPRVYPGGVTK